MPDLEVAACACVGAVAAHGTATVPAVRDLALRRRRSKIPWMYAVYHAAPQVPGARAVAGAGVSQRRQEPAEAGSHECDWFGWVAER